MLTAHADYNFSMQWTLLSLHNNCQTHFEIPSAPQTMHQWRNQISIKEGARLAKIVKNTQAYEKRTTTPNSTKTHGYATGASQRTAPLIYYYYRSDGPGT